MQSLKDRFPGEKFVFLVSIMADKDVDEMLALLAPLAKRFVTVAAHNPRAMPAETLAEHIRAYGCTAEAADSIEAGVARAEELGGEGPVCALGTLYFSGDVRQAFCRADKRLTLHNISDKEAVTRAGWVIAFLAPCGAGRVNDKKVNEENSNFKNKGFVLSEEPLVKSMYPT